MASLRRYLPSASTRTRRLLLLSNPHLCNRSSSPLASSPSPQPSTPPVGFRFSSSLSQITRNLRPTNSRVFSSRSLDLDDAQGPAAIDYRSVLQEDEFHRLADETIQDLQEKFEEYGDCIQIDGLDIDYGNQVLTLKLGSLGTYVLNKQTPNRQIWLSSPVSGPSRFDWDRTSQAWVYRRTKAKLLQLLENELEQLCGKPINLS
ncbi:frataxin, mitochondrial [Cinnamomum micranthum f. kanehirae]|uniref:ferroxidase n=1 Tax=Cinnamomum micranthum f. kanehirae TaxID=337451 RepID=A0A3S3QMK0_9MAGN|nr:frataxin, mitochondrial [Cinnamomum micranthum f. kanehirae]